MTETTTKKPKAADVDKLRAEVAKAAAAQEAARKAERAANRELRAAGRRLAVGLAAGLDLTPAERRALGLPKAAK